MYGSLIVLGALIVWKFFLSGGDEYAEVPTEVMMRYVPSDFNLELDEAEVLEILSNPMRNKKEFNQLVYRFNTSLLLHVARRLGMDASLQDEIIAEYEKHHPYLRRLFWEDFIQMKDTASTIYKSWYENEATGAVQALYEVASKYTCPLISMIIGGLLPDYQGKIYIQDGQTPCGVALTEGLKPMIDRLKERAAIEDFNRAKGLLRERVEKTIAELATVEVRDRKGISRSLQTRLWGFNISTTDLEISAISIAKVGFRLDRYFDISLNEKSRLVVVTLPEPEILSHEVYPKVDRLDIGWLREVENVDFNKNIELLRSEFRRELQNSDAFSKAKQEAVQLMHTMLEPMIKSLDPRYKLRVKFVPRSSAFAEDVPEEDPFRN